MHTRTCVLTKPQHCRDGGWVSTLYLPIIYIYIYISPRNCPFATIRESRVGIYISSLISLVALKKAGCFQVLGGRTLSTHSLLGAGVLGHSLGALGHSVLGQLAREQEPHSSLDLPGGDGGPLVVVGQAGGLSSDPLKDVVDKGVHDAHGLGGDTGVRVHLLQDLVDVDGIGLLPPLLALLLITLGDSFLGLARLLGGLSRGLGWHVDS